MQGCAMQLGDGRVSGICLGGFHGYALSRGFVVFTPYASWQGIGFMVSFTPYASTHMGSLRIVVFSVRNGLGAREAPRGNCQEDWTGPDDNFYSASSCEILGLQGLSKIPLAPQGEILLDHKGR